jgi:serine acetyltransferase
MFRIKEDINFAHQRRWPNRPMSLASRLWLLAISPGLQLILTHRIIHWLYLKRKQNDGIRKWLWRFILIFIGPLKLVILINSKSNIANDCEIEGGVFFSDQGYILFGALKTGKGTVIGPRVTIGMGRADLERPELSRNVWMGSDCVIYGAPELGLNVWIGSDCVIHGAISIGDGATLMPGTVLTKSIPGGVVMQGNPARLVLRNFDNSELRERQDADALQYLKNNMRSS